MKTFKNILVILIGISFLSFIVGIFVHSIIFIISIGVLFITSIVAVIVEGIEKNNFKRITGLQKCSYCAELIKAEATVCKYCGRKV